MEMAKSISKTLCHLMDGNGDGKIDEKDAKALLSVVVMSWLLTSSLASTKGGGHGGGGGEIGRHGSSGSLQSMRHINVRIVAGQGIV